MRRLQRLAHVLVGVAAGGVVLIGGLRLSGASIFGEENLTLGQILFQTIQQTDELRRVASAAGETAEALGTLTDTYARVNAGIEELSHYSVDAFLGDFKGDVYRLYPELAKVEHGTARLRSWQTTHTSSPFSAYEAVSALAGDLTQPLRSDIKAGRRSLDKEIILQTEAAGGFALAEVAEGSTAAYDREIDRLRKEYERRADPGTAAMVAAHTNLIIAEQNSHIIRLLARAVRLDGVDKAVRAAEQVGATRDAYRRRSATDALAEGALSPPSLVKFKGLE